jgi:glycosyltransferase involved in cell wall biosynthesis
MSTQAPRAKSRNVKPEGTGGAPLLTILIPTRNRRHRVVPLVAYLIENLPKADHAIIEILVLDNCSDDNTAQALSTLESPMLRVSTNAVYQPTSEENVFHGLSQARGEFIWFLGDDDVPRLNGVLNMLDLIKADVSDLFVFNFRVLDGDGRVASLSQIRSAPEDLQSTLPDIIKRIGMINMLSGWSIIVARRSMLSAETAYEIMKTSPIYAHCFWFLKSFSNARARFVARPLVDYRVFHAKGGWETYTAEKGVGYLYYWHLGLLRLFEMALAQNLLSARDIAEIFEYRHNGTKYRGIDEITFKLIEQADCYVDTRIQRNLLSPEELEQAFNLILKIDLSLLDVTYKIRDMYEILWLNDIGTTQQRQRFRDARTVAAELLWARQSDLYEPFLIEMTYGYCIYNWNGYWIGIRVDALSFIDAVFAQFQPKEMAPGILVAATRQGLLNAIAKAPPIAEPVGARLTVADASLIGDASVIADSSNAAQSNSEAALELMAIKASTSWRITAPLRRIVIALRGR